MDDDTVGGNNPTRARLRDVLTHPKELWLVARDSFSAWIDDFAPSMGAAISYYTVFSIAPLLLIVIAVAGLVLGQEAASGQIFSQLEGLLGDEGATAIEGMVESASLSGKSFFATAAGAVTLVIGATTVFGELQSALDRIWETPAAEKKEGIWNLLRTRVLSFGMVLAVGFLLLISLVVSAALAALGSWWAPIFGGWEILLHAVNFIVSFGVTTALFALIYKFLPSTKIAWSDVWVGAAATALLFTIGKILIGLYIGKSSIASGFGAAGSLVVVLVWVYYSAQIFLLGAEFTWVYAFRHGSRRGEKQGQPSSNQEQHFLPNKGASDADCPDAPATAPRAGGMALARTTAALQPSGGWNLRNAMLALAGAIASGWVLGKLTDVSGRRAKSMRQPPLWRRVRTALTY